MARGLASALLIAALAFGGCGACERPQGSAEAPAAAAPEPAPDAPAALEERELALRLPLAVPPPLDSAERERDEGDEEAAEEAEERAEEERERAEEAEERAREAAERAAEGRPVRPRRVLSESEIRQRREARAARRVARSEARVEEIPAIEDPQERALRVYELDPGVPAERAVLLEFLRSDPVAEVRAEAALQLVFGEPRDVMPALSRALRDPSPKVVLAALDSIEVLGEPAMRGDVERLLAHDDPEVRSLAGDVLFSLE